uniref:Uncharacterized protein n=1 Tax=Populus trichocarpa TaxID=3694 RepID=A0A2K1YMM1_POPTR
MASSPAPSLGVEPKPNITQLCFSICSMILLCGFINKNPSLLVSNIQKFPTCSIDKIPHNLFLYWIFQSQAILFIFPSTFNIKPSCHIYLQWNCGFAAGSHSSQTLSVAQQSNPTASLLYMWLNRKPNLLLFESVYTNGTDGGYRACTNQA